MIITEISGGLGNQMFKYAMAKNLALKNGVDLKLDLTWFEKEKINETSRVYGLDIFKISEKKASQKEILKPKDREWKNGKRFLIHNLIHANKNIYIKENYFQPKKLNFNKDIYLDGAWQSEKYFKDIKKELLEIFSLKEQFNNFRKDLKLEIKNSNSISLHIRRTDYIKKSHKYEICNLEYYEQAINKMVLKEKNIKIFIFSDDINWVKSNLKTHSPIVFVENNRDYEDLILMSLCKHNIIANSSFGWWGAWLNQNLDKIVIAPKKWFINKERDINNLIPSKWLQI